MLTVAPFGWFGVAVSAALGQGLAYYLRLESGYVENTIGAQAWLVGESMEVIAYELHRKRINIFV